MVLSRQSMHYGSWATIHNLRGYAAYGLLMIAYISLRECALSTAGGGTKNLGEIYRVYLAIPPKKTAWDFAIPPHLGWVRFRDPPPPSDLREFGA